MGSVEALFFGIISFVESLAVGLKKTPGLRRFGLFALWNMSVPILAVLEARQPLGTYSSQESFNLKIGQS